MTVAVPGASAEVRSDGSRPRAAGRVLRLVGAGVVALVGIGWALPHVTGAAWSDVRSVLADVTFPELAELAGIWAAGLLAYSFVLTGALPGLSRRRALTLNLTGSAVSNVAPMGGALGVATNLAMLRAWRFRPGASAAFTLVTNAWDVLGKLALPLVALAAVVAAPDLTSGPLRAAAVSTGVVLLVLLLAIVLVLRSDRMARAVGRGGAAVLRRSRLRTVAARASAFESALLETRTRVLDVVARTWPQLTGGTFAYLALQALLLWACLDVVGAAPRPTVVLAGFAVERLLTLAVVTPGGAGLAEAGSAGVLVALGVDPLTATAGVLLYRGFTFLLEIPVGGLWLGGWVLARSRLARQGA